MQRELLTNGATSLVAGLAGTLGQLKYLNTIAPPILQSLVRHCTLVRLVPGDVLIREGDLTAEELYVLLQGSLLVRSGERLISRLDRPGEIVGELAVLQSPPRTADVVADSVAQVLAVRPETLVLPEFEKFGATFYQMLSYGLANKLRTLTVQTRERIDRVEREAATDPLTGLANRKALDETLAALSTAQNGLAFSLIMADVDHFKNYNDSNGHPMGDVVLTKIASILNAKIRLGDLAARYGGEEFVVVLPNCNMVNAKRIAEGLRAAIEGEYFPLATKQPLGRITATFGVATFTGAETVDALLGRADQAMYQGKKAGRNRVIVAS